MKKFTLSLVMTAAALFGGNHLCAQTIESFDFTNAKNYYLIYLDDETIESNIAKADIKKDYRVDDTVQKLYIWEDTYKSKDAVGPNSNGVPGSFLDLTVGNIGWAGCGFAGVAPGKDLAGLDDSYYLHFAVKTNADNNGAHMITTGGLDKHEAHIVLDDNVWTDGNTGAKYDPYANFTRDGEWYNYDISVKTLKQLGAAYTDPAYTGNAVALVSDGKSAGQNICLDAVFFYQKKDGSAIVNEQADAIRVLVGDHSITVEGYDAGISLYDISGKGVKASDVPAMNTDDVAKGIYILKAGEATKKIVIR